MQNTHTHLYRYTSASDEWPHGRYTLGFYFDFKRLPRYMSGHDLIGQLYRNCVAVYAGEPGTVHMLDSYMCSFKYVPRYFYNETGTKCHDYCVEQTV